MEEFKLTEEDIAFTPDQLDRIEYLRKQRELNNKPAPKGDNTSKFQYKKGDPIYIDLNGTKFTGHIEKVNGPSKYYTTYDVSTPHGILKDIERAQITKRVLQDLSTIEVPEVLKELPASLLLKLLRSTYTSVYSWDSAGPAHAWHLGKSYSDVEIKAALIGKPHIGNKRERTKVKEHNRKNK